MHLSHLSGLVISTLALGGANCVLLGQDCYSQIYDHVVNGIPITTTYKGAAAVTGLVQVGANCPWTASSNVSWLTIPTITRNPPNGSLLSGTVTYLLAVNSSPLRRTGTLTIAEKTFTVIQAGALAGDVGVFRSGFFWVEDVDGTRQFDGPLDRAFAFGGLPGDIPITGDWNGSGSTKVGVYRPSIGLFVLDYDGDGQFTSADKVYYDWWLGTAYVGKIVPVVGDWNGDGRTKVGTFSNGYFWHLDYNGDGVNDYSDYDITGPNVKFGGLPGDVPVVGDWNGDGKSKIGIFRQGYFWILDYNGDYQFDEAGGDRAFAFGGLPGDVPVVGDWNGDGKSKVGVFRAGFFWVLDANGNYHFDGTGAGQDLAFPFGGISGDKPVVGRW